MQYNLHVMKVQDLTDDLDYKLEPIIHLKNGRPVPVCYELLLRSKKTQVFPREVLLQALADEEINDELLTWKKQQLLKLFQSKKYPSLSINLAPQQLYYASTWRFLKELIPYQQQLVIEITEEPALQMESSFYDRIKALRELGFAIALDDVGMGQNNQEMVSYNSDFLAAIKFSLLQYSTQQLAERVKAIVQWKNLAQQKGLILVVEGIETLQEADLFATYGCLQQGYLWNRWLCLQ